MPKKKTNTTEQEYVQYFNSHVKEDDSGCYLWTAAKNNVGYGLFRYHNGMASAHRVQMQMQGHNIENKVVYHTCDNYHCVNPDHLRIGTRKDKSEMAVSRGKIGATFTNTKYFKQCPHCDKLANPAVYAHAHGDRCKQKPNGK